MNSLPHRFSESAFRKYEKVIAQLATTYPRPIRISPAQFGLSPETIRGRLRDACTSFAQHKWPTQLVNIPSFDAIDHDKLTISILPDGMVVAGEKSALKESTIDVIDAIAEDEIFNVECNSTTNPVELLMTLAHNGVLKKKLRLALTAREYQQFSASFDIVLTTTPDPGIYLLS